MTTARGAVARLGLGLLLIIVGGIAFGRADRGLSLRRFVSDGRPMTFMVLSPEERLRRHQLANPEPHDHDEERELAVRLPGVIVAHGFAGSSKLMLGYGIALAQAGYAVVLTDLGGHGANPRPLDRATLADDLEAAHRALLRQPETDAARVSLIGHSMGSGAVMRAALAAPERYVATVALSPVGADVTPATPRNLQLQAGTLESRYLGVAEILLERAGGASEDFANGRARELVAVPGAEHVTILWRDASHAAALRWLDAAVRPQQIDERPGYRDRRILWWLAHVVGWLLLLASMRPLVNRDAAREARAGLVRRPLQWWAVGGAPFIATLLCGLLSRVVDLGAIAGMAVGGAIALWLLIAGVVFLLAGFRIGTPDRRDLLAGAGLFVFLWLAIGLSADVVWLQWTLVSPRLWRWPLLALACIPWFVATELAQGDPRGRGRLVWWVAQTAALIAGLVLLTWMVPGLGLIVLMLPLLPLVTAALVAAGSRVNRPWGYGIAAGAFFAWLLASSFPLGG